MVFYQTDTNESTSKRVENVFKKNFHLSVHSFPRDYRNVTQFTSSGVLMIVPRTQQPKPTPGKLNRQREIKKATIPYVHTCIAALRLPENNFYHELLITKVKGSHLVYRFTDRKRKQIPVNAGKTRFTKIIHKTTAFENLQTLSTDTENVHEKILTKTLTKGRGLTLCAQSIDTRFSRHTITTFDSLHS